MNSKKRPCNKNAENMRASIHTSIALALFSISRSTFFQKTHFRSTKLFSLGDPDLSTTSSLYRLAQDYARQYDNFIFKDPDIPGKTYLTPICWGKLLFWYYLSFLLVANSSTFHQLHGWKVFGSEMRMNTDLHFFMM